MSGDENPDALDWQDTAADGPVWCAQRLGRCGRLFRKGTPEYEANLDRGGTVEKLTPDLYGPIIEEARSLGGTVTAHIFYQEDAKELLRAGLHGFAHGVRDEVVDDEFLALLDENPDVFLIPNLPERGPRSEADLAYAAETLPAAAIDAMREADAAFEIDADELFVPPGSLIADPSQTISPSGIVEVF